MLRYYGVDLVKAIRTGRPGPALLLSLIAALPQGSMTHALLAEDRALLGWSREAAVVADVFDAVYDNMVGTSMAKFKQKPKPYPRPGHAKGHAAKGDGTVKTLARHFGVY